MNKIPYLTIEKHKQKWWVVENDYQELSYDYHGHQEYSAEPTCNLWFTLDPDRNLEAQLSEHNITEDDIVSGIHDFLLAGNTTVAGRVLGRFISDAKSVGLI